MDTKQTNNVAESYREAADRIWELAKDYESKGLRDLAEALTDIALEVHDLAREKEIEER